MVKPVVPMGKMDFEQLNTENWVMGKIVEVQERVNENRTYKGQAKPPIDEVRFKFEFYDYKYHHYSRWMSRSIGEKANLYIKYLKPLCPDLLPDVAIDLDALVGIEIKTMWDNEKNTKDGREYQALKIIKPIKPLTVEDVALKDLPEEPPLDSDLPF